MISWNIERSNIWLDWIKINFLKLTQNENWQMLDTMWWMKILTAIQKTLLLMYKRDRSKPSKENWTLYWFRIIEKLQSFKKMIKNNLFISKKIILVISGVGLQKQEIYLKFYSYFWLHNWFILLGFRIFFCDYAIVYCIFQSFWR